MQKSAAFRVRRRAVVFLTRCGFVCENRTLAVIGKKTCRLRNFLGDDAAKEVCRISESACSVAAFSGKTRISRGILKWSGKSWEENVKSWGGSRGICLVGKNLHFPGSY